MTGRNIPIDGKQIFYGDTTVDEVLQLLSDTRNIGDKKDDCPRCTKFRDVVDRWEVLIIGPMFKPKDLR